MSPASTFWFKNESLKGLMFAWDVAFPMSTIDTVDDRPTRIMTYRVQMFIAELRYQ